ncbi:hypothetical protein QM806_27815 [Rhodococcus sp. IEGM 1351]|uniref:hypothetical protein n=1 Tax=Rhodococcus sp. IEGM 1351 TaxID=3047089 RepID=UPI0024B6E0C5|nr:hypothetical protein [Rhodococcus sp. IEGM 1351]MDI9939197.1 hypothetical protein [Rhodococcus sp. IEGM 1351]
MSDVERLLAAEAAAAEANIDAPVPEGAKVTRPNRARSVPYSIRLNPKELAAVQELATQAQIPPSTLIRSWVIDRLRVERGEIGDAEAELRAAQRHLAMLERHLSHRAS